MTLQYTLDAIAAQQHSIIALSAAPSVGAETQAWVDHLNFVSNEIEQRPAILVVPFADIDDAKQFKAQPEVETSYRIVAACYHGALGQEPELAASVAAALADSQDPTLPFNGVNLGLQPVSPEHALTNTQIENALKNGICIIQNGADGKPEIVRAISTYSKNPDNGLPDDIMLDINGALTIDYIRKVLIQAAGQERRRKNTAVQRRNLRSLFIAEMKKLEDAEIVQFVDDYLDQLTVEADPNDDYRVNVNIPTHWVRGMHVIATTISVY